MTSLALLLSATISIQVNVTSFDMTGDTESQSLNLMDELSDFNQQAEQQRQAMEKVIRKSLLNNKTVIDLLVHWGAG